MGDGKVLHVGVGPGEVAQRIVTCGTPTRAAALAAHLDGVNGAAAKDCSHIFYFESSRGFTTYTVRLRSIWIAIDPPRPRYQPCALGGSLH